MPLGLRQMFMYLADRSLKQVGHDVSWVACVASVVQCFRLARHFD